MDPRTICLVRLAVRNMTRVNTLRIVFGHPKMTEALLRCFFDAYRERENPVKRLWLENVRIVEGTEIILERHKYGLPLHLDFTGVEKLRLRRLPLNTMEKDQHKQLNDRREFVYTRGKEARELQNGLGGMYLTSTNNLGMEIVKGHEHMTRALAEEGLAKQRRPPAKNPQWPVEELMAHAMRFDDAIYEALSKEIELPTEVVQAAEPMYKWRSILAYRELWPGPDLELSCEGNRIFRQLFRVTQPTAGQCALPMFRNMASTLSSLTIDWALTPPKPRKMKPEDYENWIRWYVQLFKLRCPHLKSFQYRNAVASQTLLPEGLYLFDHSTIFTDNGFERQWVPGKYPTPPYDVGLGPLEFFEAHGNLQSLAWPMDQFFSPTRSTDISTRVRDVIERLGETLVDLRVDVLYTGAAEARSGDDLYLDHKSHGEFLHFLQLCPDADKLAESMLSRRRFINEFASKMQKLKSIKVEGGMPLDERRETISALRQSPIEKLVFIGVASVIGNTWGENGSAYNELVVTGDAQSLEAEDEPAIYDLGTIKPETVNTAFEPSYGWSGRGPMLHAIVSQHGSTLRELKFCGYKGAINLYDPSPIVHPLLASLKHCHALESLIMSFWVSTLFEDGFRDEQVISYWLDGRDSSSTALVMTSPDEPEPGSWAYELKSKFAPAALACRLVRFLGPYLSETAKKREGGVHVRASFCVGDWGGIFDIDVQIGKSISGRDDCLGFEGPREELEEKRRKEKLESRRWF